MLILLLCAFSQEDLFGQGPVCASCHVMITKEYTDKIEPPFESEIALLEVRSVFFLCGVSFATQKALN